MSPQSRILVCVAALVAMATGILLFRADTTVSESVSAVTTAYEVRIRYAINSADPDFVLRAHLPRDTRTKTVFHQTVVHTGLEVERAGSAAGSRDLEITVPPHDALREHVLDIELGIIRRLGDTDKRYGKRKLDAERRARYLTLDFNDPDAERYRFLLGHERSQTPNPAAVVAQAMRAVRQIDAWDKLHDDRDRRRAFIWYCRTRGVPARESVGLRLDGASANDYRYWVESYVDGQWQIWDPRDPEANSARAAYLPFNPVDAEAYEVEGDGTVDVEITVARRAIPDWVRGDEADWYSAVDFFALSLEQRESIGVLLMLPFGVLLTVFTRTLLGQSTYGTFGPTLLALGLVASEPRVFAVVTAVVAGVSLAGLTVLARLSLPRIPRVSIVFSLVAITVSFSVTAMNWFGLDANHADVFLPLAVLTILVDQFMRTLQNKGTAKALARLLRTFVLTFVIALVLQQDWLAARIVRMPELHLLTVAGILAIGAVKATRADQRNTGESC